MRASRLRLLGAENLEAAGTNNEIRSCGIQVSGQLWLEDCSRASEVFPLGPWILLSRRIARAARMRRQRFNFHNQSKEIRVAGTRAEIFRECELGERGVNRGLDMELQ